VEDSKVLDVSFLKKEGYLSGWRSGLITWKIRENVTGSVGVSSSISGNEGSMRLTYSITGRGTEEKRQFDYTVRLVKTGCNYGGGRWWFLCPLRECGKRVAKLYLPSGGEYFGCRSCYRLTYESCRMSHSSIYRLAKAHGMTLGQMGKGMRH